MLGWGANLVRDVYNKSGSNDFVATAFCVK